MTTVTPKILNAPDCIYLCYGSLDYIGRGIKNHEDAFRDSQISWSEEKEEERDVKYIRADIVVALQEEINALRGQNEK